MRLKKRSVSVSWIIQRQFLSFPGILWPLRQEGSGCLTSVFHSPNESSILGVIIHHW